MNPRPNFRCIVLALSLAISCAALAQSGWTEAETHAAEAFLRASFHGNAGMVIGLCDKIGNRVFSAGKLDDGSDREVDGDTVFELGSVTKVFTALLALDAARRGEVKLDDPVSRYLPRSVKVPAYEGKEITLRNLAAQDSGLPFHHGNLNDWETKGISLMEVKKACEAVTADDLYAFLSSYKLTSAPGTKFGYSNPGMALLGHVLALKTGQSYESLVVDRICRRLGMESTRITLTPELKARLARGHFVNGEPAENLRFQVMEPAGAFLSTTNDMLTFVAANLALTETELTPLMTEMQERRHTGAQRFGNTAMPWMDEGLYQPPGSELLGHGGGGYGYLAFIGFDKKKRRGVVVLSNQMAISPPGVGWALLQGVALSRENVAYMVREIVGVGLAFQTDEKTGLLQITTVYPNSPAGEAGLAPGTLIQSIEGIPVAQKSVQECLAMMRGPDGTKVRFELVVTGRQETRALELTRRKFVTSSERIK